MGTLSTLRTTLCVLVDVPLPPAEATRPRVLGDEIAGVRLDFLVARAFEPEAELTEADAPTVPSLDIARDVDREATT